MTAFDNSEFEKYKLEAREKWGNTDAYKQHAEKTKNYSKQKWDDLSAGMNHIMAEFALCMKNGLEPNCNEAQSLVKTLQSYITENYYLCTNEILSGLAQMYVADERFRNNIDKHADGTARFILEGYKLIAKSERNAKQDKKLCGISTQLFYFINLFLLKTFL